MLSGLGAIVGFVGSTSTSGGTGGSFAVDVSPTVVTKSGVGTGPRTLTTRIVTVTASGGAGGYTYAWSGGGSVSATAPTAATTSFSATLSPGDTVMDEYVCTVTDASGAHLTTETVSITITLDDGSI